MVIKTHTRVEILCAFPLYTALIIAPDRAIGPGSLRTQCCIVACKSLRGADTALLLCDRQEVGGPLVVVMILDAFDLNKGETMLPPAVSTAI